MARKEIITAIAGAALAISAGAMFLYYRAHRTVGEFSYFRTIQGNVTYLFTINGPDGMQSIRLRSGNTTYNVPIQEDQNPLIGILPGSNTPFKFEYTFQKGKLISLDGIVELEDDLERVEVTGDRYTTLTPD